MGILPLSIREAARRFMGQGEVAREDHELISRISEKRPY
jgi:hypothetical protein